jgi:uncharacterized protein DUF4340
MKNKKEYLISAVIIVVLTGYLVLRNTDRNLYQLPVVDEIRSGEITKIDIRKSEGDVILEKRDNRWFVGQEGYLSDSKKIDTLLDAIKTLTVTALISESKSYSRYDLDSEKKITVNAWAGDTLARQFDIGKSASTFRHTHVKFTDDPNVYHARGNFRNSFDRQAAYFRDMAVLSFERQDIQEIEIVKQDQTVVIARRQIPVTVDVKKSEGNAEDPSPAPQVKWQRSDGKGVDESALDSLLASLFSLKCDDYIDGKTRADFGKPQLSLSFKGTENHTLSVFEKPDEQEKRYPAISSDTDYPFVLSESKWEQIASKIDETLK